MNYKNFQSLVQNYSGSQYKAPIPRATGYHTKPSIVVTTKTIGLSAHDKALKNFDRNMQRAVVRGVKKAVKFLLEQTLLVTPISDFGSVGKGGRTRKPGNLRRSGNTAVQIQGQQTVGIVYFDDGKAPYAIYVHEDLTKFHKPPTIAKFLQVTQYKNRGEISRIIREEVAKARP